ncbi:MAG TPA: ComF family protein [Firmicutes bacterium]|nr:ComF family protein [Bacillota bacterium]
MKFFAALLDLLFPPACAVCRGRMPAEEQNLCARCRGKILPAEKCCLRCGYPLAGEFSCRRCRGYHYAFSRACAVFLYQGEVRKAVRRFKYGGRTGLARPFGELMAAQVAKHAWPACDAVVPVPLHPGRLRERGYDQALLLARAVADALQLPVRSCLERCADTASQTTMAARERWENVRGVFQLLPGEVVSGRLLLIDDLLTTGATAHHAAEALLAGGAEAVFLAVLCRS